ncbi:hypothetical protein GF361_02050 [Candidatus Woesearchaeota archaeon]|nr:hypothetical protein [Candidatus Woesearchaeota archaeon]
MKEEKKKIIISLFVIFLMVSSILGYMFGRSGIEKYKYNSFSFFKRNNEWVLDGDEGELSFNLFPEQVENIEMDFDAADVLQDKAEVDVTSDPESKYAEAIAVSQLSIQQNLMEYSDTFVVLGMTENDDGFDLPVIGCEDATESVPVLYFKESNSTGIKLEDNHCIILEAENELDFLRLKDRLLYSYIGIIK